MGQKKEKYKQLYEERALSLGYPNLEHLGSEYKKKRTQLKIIKHDFEKNDNSFRKSIFNSVARLVDIEHLSKKTIDIGCGPTPIVVKELMMAGMDAKGVEPIDEMRQYAQEFLGDEKRVLKGYAEKIPVPDNSQSFVSLNSVLEHVLSPPKVMEELYRILEPGGAAYIQTTNKYMFTNGEFTKRFFQWYPAILKESYFFLHLHYHPELANYSSRPAVHWFSYSDLCKLGRNAGFFSFYSLIDVASEEDLFSASSLTGKCKRFIFQLMKYNPMLRSLVLIFTNLGGIIFMVKR